MDNWPDDGAAQPTEDAPEVVFGFGHRTFRVGGIHLTASDHPECLDGGDSECCRCEFFTPSACPLRKQPFYLQNLKVLLARIPQAPDRAALNHSVLHAALQFELRSHGRPLHYMILARMVADRYPTVQVSPKRVSLMLCRHPECYDRILPGVYRWRPADPIQKLNPSSPPSAVDLENELAEPPGPRAPVDYRAEEGPAYDLLRVFRKEVSRFSLLDARQEARLAEAIARGRTARSQLAAKHDPTRQALLEQIGLQGDQAKQQLVEANLRLVLHFARWYLGRGLELMDLIQAGCLGLIAAASKFDHTLGYRFSTYASWWIKQAIYRTAADESRLIHLPAHLHERIGAVQRAADDVESELGREPTSEEIAAETELLSDEARWELDAILQSDQPPSHHLVADLAKAAAQVDQTLLHAAWPLSLDDPVDLELLAVEPYLGGIFDIDDLAAEDQELTLGELVAGLTADKRQLDLLDQAWHDALKAEVTAVLGSLKHRERRVLEMRYGLKDGTAHTLEEIGQAFGVTRERIRQIEAAALKRLKHPLRARRLRSYIVTRGGTDQRQKKPPADQ